MALDALNKCAIKCRTNSLNLLLVNAVYPPCVNLIVYIYTTKCMYGFACFFKHREMRYGDLGAPWLNPGYWGCTSALPARSGA